MALACSGAQPPDAAPGRRKDAAATSGTDPRLLAQRVPALKTTTLVQVPAGTYGPYLGVAAATHVMVWAAPEKEQTRGWYSLALSSTGKKLSRPLRIADAPAEVGLVAVKAASKDQRSTTTADLNASGFVLVTTRPGANIEVSATVLGRHGELKAGPTVLAQEEADVLWVDAIATTRGWLVLWAVRRDDRADVLGIELSATGDHVGKSKVLVEGARAWQAAPVAAVSRSLLRAR